MKILFINSNRYKFPPVIPIGIEYLAGSLSKTQHTYKICDLCFSDKPIDDLNKALAKFKPEIVGITIRQIDTVLYQNNEFFLPEIKSYVDLCKLFGCKVILGGSGYSIMPQQILKYTRADYGIEGPGELALIHLLNKLKSNKNVPSIINGYSYFKNLYYHFKREILFDYKKYFNNGGIAGFRTQIGCNENCIFCTEGNKRIIYHHPESVAKEIAQIKQLGYTKFHLCDSEFNLNLEHCIKVCKAMCNICGSTNWALYMKPGPYSDELFYWLNKSGADLITLSLNTNYSAYDKLKNFCLAASKNNIKIAVDLSTGFPNEDIESLKLMLDTLDKLPVETVGVNSFYRIYPGTPLFNVINNGEVTQEFLINWDINTDYIKPVFYNYFNEQTLRKAIAGRKKFRIEGFEKATNYQRV